MNLKILMARPPSSFFLHILSHKTHQIFIFSAGEPHKKSLIIFTILLSTDAGICMRDIKYKGRLARAELMSMTLILVFNPQLKGFISIDQTHRWDSIVWR